MVNFFKLLLLFWPFFKSVIFKDRPVKEVIRANKQFTYLFVITMFLALTLYMAVETLALTRQQLLQERREQTQLRRKLTATEQQITQLTLDLRSVDEACRPTRYDKRHLLNLIEEGGL